LPSQIKTASPSGQALPYWLPFLATDRAVHELLDSHTVAEAQQLQVVLGKIRPHGKSGDP